MYVKGAILLLAALAALGMVGRVLAAIRGEGAYCQHCGRPRDGQKPCRCGKGARR